MKNSQPLRLIARLDVKGENVVKGVHLEGLKVVGKPEELARKYTKAGIDELIYVDSVASLYGRNNLHHIVEKTAKEIHIPITVEGGVRSLDDIKKLLRAGADKVAINTYATKDPNFIKEASEKFGSQCIVLSVSAKKKGPNTWEAYTDNGREVTGLDVVEWCMRGEELGAGEILLTSIDQEGTYSGFDLDLYKSVTSRVGIPVIASGGAGKLEHINELVSQVDIRAIALASVFHYNNLTVNEVKNSLIDSNVSVRVNAKSVSEKNLSAINWEKKKIGIVDHGAGNLFSLMNSLEKINVEAKIITSPSEVEQCDSLLLPGVGSFSECMNSLKTSGFDVAIKKFASTGKPLMGICLGAQVLLSEGEEHGMTEGLDLIPGQVISIRPKNSKKDYDLKIPHIGWSKLNKKDASVTGQRITAEISDGDEVYFVHSFKMVPQNIAHVISTTTYSSQEIAAVIQKDNVYGCQFHPEKSGEVGVSILRKFCEL